MSSATLLIAGVAYCLATLFILRGGLRSPRRHTEIVGMDVEGGFMAIASIGFAMWFFGPLYGLALILVVVIHEFGHVAAFRICGHDDARFRLVPLMGGVAISNQIPASQEKQFFISLMGPAIGIGPMILAFGLVPLAAQIHPMAASFLWVFGSVTGALNFFNMLPFWPLDGGKMIQILAYSFWPPLALALGTVMSAAFIVAAIGLQSILLFFFALMGAQSLFHAGQVIQVQRPMSRRRALLATAAYLFTAATLATGGLGLILSYI